MHIIWLFCPALEDTKGDSEQSGTHFEFPANIDEPIDVFMNPNLVVKHFCNNFSSNFYFAEN